VEKALALHDAPFNELLLRAQTVRRQIAIPTRSS